MFTAAPKMIPLPEAVHNIQAKLNKVHHGLELLSQYLDRAAQGAQKVAEGNRQVYQHLSQASKEYGRVIKAFDAQTKLISNVMKINQRLQDKIDLVDWAPVIDKMNTALSVENELLGLLLDGGAFSQRTLNFIEAHGGKKPPVDTFPADIARLRKKFEENRSRLAEKKLPRLKKLKEGSRKLADSIQRLQKEGAEKIKRKLAAQSDPLLRKLAALEKAKKTAAAYDRFTGTKPPNRPAPPSAVQFIMKTPGDTVP